MSAEAIIKLEGLGKQFQTTNGTVNALDNINLEIEKGEIFGIIGLSGAGKSTLVRCINFLEKPTAGKVIFEGQSLGELGESGIRAARRSMGMIFQQFNLLAQRNVLQNVCFPLEIAGVPKHRSPEAGKGTASNGWARRADEGVSGPAFRRTKAEGSHCQGSGYQSESAAVRRGHQRLRPQHHQVYSSAVKTD